jgi:hypothetical protein
MLEAALVLGILNSVLIGAFYYVNQKRLEEIEHKIKIVSPRNRR